MAKKNLKSLSILFLLLGINSCIHLASMPRQWTGTVVDGSTGKPLQGATVSLVWGTKGLIQMDGGTDFLSAEETVTDMRGKFELPATPAYLINPFQRIEDIPRALVTKPGYTVGKGIKVRYFDQFTWNFNSEVTLMPCWSPKALPINEYNHKSPVTSFPYLRICPLDAGPWCNPPDKIPRLVASISDPAAPVCDERP